MSEWTTGIRFDPEWDRGQIALDCQIGINTPVRRRSSTRCVHTDAPDELFAMLLYFRRDDDRVPGGDLEICQWKKNAPHLFVDRDVDESDTERRAVVPYKANTLVIFINSTLSLHAVTPARSNAAQPSACEHCRPRPSVRPGGLVRKAAEEGTESHGGTLRYQNV